MQIEKNWESFKVTRLLYAIVFVLTFNFYLIHITFDSIQYQAESAYLIYMTSAISVLFTLYSIYFTRIYIQRQMKKHAIIDVETTLFSKQYFLAEIKSACARSVRHDYPLSILHIEIEDFQKANKHYDKKTKLHTLKSFGTLVHTLVRDGDLPSRYDENHFLILLPFTNKENALNFEKRIHEAMMQEDCMISENIKLNFTITEFNKEETEEAFVQRTLAS